MYNPITKKTFLALLSLILAVSFLAAPGAGPVNAQGASQIFYVAPDGKPGNSGSPEQPWDLQTAFDQPDALRPGDRVIVRGGTYQGEFTVRLNGSEGGWIIVQAAGGERAVLTNSEGPAIDFKGASYTVLMGLEISGGSGRRSPSRSESAYGVRVNQGESSHHIKLISMIIHDVTAQGIGWWQALEDSEIYGSLFYFNGTTQLDHGVYAHNVSGKKVFADNIVIDSASHGFHGYAETNEKGLNNLVLQGNTFANNGSVGYTTGKDKYGVFKRNILVGGLIRANNAVIANNYTYYPGSEGAALNLGYEGGSKDARVTGNYFAGGSFDVSGGASGLALKGNTIYAPGGTSGADAASHPDNQWLSDRPGGVKVFVRPNAYQPHRANVTIYNWDGAASVSIPASALAGVALAPGQAYELRNAQDYFGDVITGKYDGSAIRVPMTGRSVAQPLGLDFRPASTFPEFGALILIAK